MINLKSLHRAALPGLVAFMLLGTTAGAQQSFPTPEDAAAALAAAVKTDTDSAILKVLGKDAEDIVSSGDEVADADIRRRFLSMFDANHSIKAEGNKKATLILGPDDFPFPIPLVNSKSGWEFDTNQGRIEVLYRRIGRNELDAIEVCRGYVEAQEEYASEPRGGSTVVQFAQHVVGSADKEDGLAWRESDGTWRGPIGEHIARAIDEGYSGKLEPYHGYYFKILKGQGPHARLGQLDFVVKGMMIGGFALVAAPADYAVTGVKSFIVSHDGVVFEKDLGPKSLDAFRAMERFDPDSSWSPVED